MLCDPKVFDVAGSRILRDSVDADLIIMDELGYLESDCEVFKNAVADIIAGSTPVLGVLRLGDVPWHESIKKDTRVAIFDVNEKTRDTLPQVISDMLRNCQV